MQFCYPLLCWGFLSNPAVAVGIAIKVELAVVLPVSQPLRITPWFNYNQPIPERNHPKNECFLLPCLQPSVRLSARAMIRLRCISYDMHAMLEGSLELLFHFFYPISCMF